jgi:hypothetical protein
LTDEVIKLVGNSRQITAHCCYDEIFIYISDSNIRPQSEDHHIHASLAGVSPTGASRPPENFRRWLVSFKPSLFDEYFQAASFISSAFRSRMKSLAFWAWLAAWMTIALLSLLFNARSHPLI